MTEADDARAPTATTNAHKIAGSHRGLADDVEATLLAWAAERDRARAHLARAQDQGERE